MNLGIFQVYVYIHIESIWFLLIYDAGNWVFSKLVYNSQIPSVPLVMFINLAHFNQVI